MKISLITASIILAVSLSGCGDGGSPASPTETVTVTAEPVETEDTSDAEYANFIRDQIPELAGVDDETIIENANAVCDSLDTGMTFNDVYMSSIDSGLSPEVVGGLVGGAIAFECPEYEYLLN